MRWVSWAWGPWGRRLATLTLIGFSLAAAIDTGNVLWWFISGLWVLVGLTEEAYYNLKDLVVEQDKLVAMQRQALTDMQNRLIKSNGWEPRP
jgi:hypothetical protein